MAYTINGKVYTDHPLMDEMIYNLDIIMQKIEIKNSETADKFESEDTITASDTFMSIKSGVISFDTFPFTKDMLMDYGYTRKLAISYSNDKYAMPVNERKAAFEHCCKWYIENYEEKNNYYRALIGLPWLDEYEDEDKYWVYIDSSYVEDEMLKEVIDFTLPLHQYDNYQIAVITAVGALDIVFKEYSGRQYKYLHFLGDAKMDLYKARRAAKWDILYMPMVEIMVMDRFKQLYQANRTLYLQRFYSDAYKIASDHYDDFMIILLLCQTYTDMIADIPEWYVRRDIFDLRSCQYFLESHGIAFFKEIPLKYQIRIVKNMNKLIRYKSTNKNIWDIIDIFKVDATVYKYYLFKKRIANERGSYAIGKDPADEYELEFVKAPIGTSYDDTIKNNIYREQYDVITYQDKWWDGMDTHDNVKAKHLAKDFTIEGTKFISLENRISLNDYEFQVEYFIGLLMDSSMKLSDITINIPTISPIVSFSLSDLFILLYCLTASYENYKMLIRTPINMRTKEKTEFEAYEDFDGGYAFTNKAELELLGYDPTVQNKFRMPANGGEDPEYTEITQETFYDWLRTRHPHVWLDMTARIYGFNMNADLEWLAEAVGFRHSAFQFTKGYTLEELGVDGFRTDQDIDSIEELVEVYQINSEIHDHVKDLIIHAETRDQKVVFQFVFDYLFTRNFDYDRYTLKSTGELAESFDEVLRERNYVLYNYYMKIVGEVDLETRRDQIRQSMNDIINTLEYYLNYDCLKYVFSIFTISSFNSILYYIYLMINFFRSWKVYFLDTYVTFKTDNKLNNSMGYIDGIGEYSLRYWKASEMPYRDTITGINLEFKKTDRFFQRDTEQVTDIYEKQEKMQYREAHWYRVFFYERDKQQIRDTITGYDLCFWKTDRFSPRDSLFLSDQLAKSDRYWLNDTHRWRVRLFNKDTQMMTDNAIAAVSLDKGELLRRNYKEVIEVFGHYTPDPTIDMDLVGENLSTLGFWNYDDFDGGESDRPDLSLDLDGGPATFTRELHQPFTRYIWIDGGDPNTEITLDPHDVDPIALADGINARNIDAGHVDFTSYIPYVVYNGGREGKGRAMFDLDGATVLDTDSRINVDGSYPEEEKHPITFKPHYYDVRGGHPSMYEYVSKAMNVTVVDNQVKAEVLLGSTYHGKANMLEIKDDGLYLRDDYATDSGQYIRLKKGMDELLESFRTYFNDSLEMITISRDPNLANQFVKKITYNYFQKALYVLKHYEEITERTIVVSKKYADTKARELYDTFGYDYQNGINLGDWGTF